MAEAEALPASAASVVRVLRHRGTRAVQRMVEFAPATGGLALWVRHQDVAAESNVADIASHLALPQRAPPIATDGHTLYYAATFERLPLPEQIGLIAHAVLHVALRHPQRYLGLQQLLGDVDLRLYTLCADAIVNSALGHLSWLRLPASAITLERLLFSALSVDQTVEVALLEWDVERLYRAIDDRRVREETGKRRDGEDGRDGGSAAQRTRSREDAQGSQMRQDAQNAPAREDGPRSARVRALGREAHADLLPGHEAQEAPELQADAARGWRERLLRAHTADGPHSMLRLLIADLPQPRTPWEQVLRTQLARGLSTRPDLSWSRPARSYIANQGRAGPHRRLPWEPGFSGTKRIPRLVVIVDVSGSIDEALLARFTREIEAITRRLEAALVLVIGDDKVQQVEHFAPGRAKLPGITFNGGGGTDFTPLLEEADRHRPDLVVVLTDLDGPARYRPRWPVIWALPPTHASAVAPFGRTLNLN